jgi:hypothetical protein
MAFAKSKTSRLYHETGTDGYSKPTPGPLMISVAELALASVFSILSKILVSLETLSS